jgi:hypothetical protein
MIGAKNDDRTNPSLSQEFCCRDKIGCQLDRYDATALADQNALDEHGSLPRARAGMRRRRSCE